MALACGHARSAAGFVVTRIVAQLTNVHAMKSCPLGIVLLCLTFAAIGGCSPERSHNVDGAQSGTNSYRQMIERSRSRKTSEDALLALKKGISEYQRDLGGPPTNLNELVVRGYLEALPAAPDGFEYGYDKDRVNVGLLPVKNQPGRSAATNSPGIR